MVNITREDFSAHAGFWNISNPFVFIFVDIYIEYKMM